jgi:hypothetical protein
MFRLLFRASVLEFLCQDGQPDRAVFARAFERFTYPVEQASGDILAEG